MLLRMPVAALLNWRGQGSRKTSLKHLKRYRGGKSREVRFYLNDPHIVNRKEKIPEDLINYFNRPERVRNRIGHPIKLLVRDNDNFTDDLYW